VLVQAPEPLWQAKVAGLLSGSAARPDGPHISR